MAAIEPLMQSLKDFHPDLLVLSGESNCCCCAADLFHRANGGQLAQPKQRVRSVDLRIVAMKCFVGTNCFCCATLLDRPMPVDTC